MAEKNFKIKGKSLNLSEINLQYPIIGDFLNSYFNNREDLEVHTSGSTGTPKPISLKKDYVRASAKKTITALRLKADNKCLLCLPVDRIGGIMMLVRWLEGGLDLYPGPVSASPLGHFNEDFDFAAMVPYQVSQSLETLDKVKKLIIGGGPIPPVLENKLHHHSGAVYHTYGMTETISHVALRQVNAGHGNAHFKALPEVSFSTDNRQCLVITAPDIGVGNLVTNDVVELHNPHTFTWKGRYDNVVNSGGVKLYPEEIEKKIGEIGHRYFLFGRPDTKFGERLAMLVEASQGLDLQKIKDRFYHLDPYERPKEIFCLPEFQMAAGGKVSRLKCIGLLG